jgi:spermidine/putrescine transport system permease protein
MTEEVTAWDRIKLLTGLVCLAAVLLLILAPPTLLVWLSINGGELISTWERFGVTWYRVAFFDERIQQAILSSIRVAGLSAILATLLAFAASIIFVRRTHLFLLSLVLGVPVFVPGLTHGLAVSNTAWYLGVGGSIYLLIIAHSAFLLPYCSVILIMSLANFPQSMLDTAMELGSSKTYTLRRVLLPHAKRGLLASLSVGFLMSLNENSRSFFLTSENLLSTYVYGKMLGGADPSLYAVGGVLYVMAWIVLFVVATIRAGLTGKGRHVGRGLTL